MEITWVSAILGLLIIYLTYWWSKKRANYWRELDVPQADYPPLLGIVKSIMFENKTFVDVSKDIYRKFSTEKYCGYNLFTVPVLLIRDLDLINQIVIKDFSYFPDRNFSSDEHLELMNASVANVTGDKWKVLRHKLTPTFSSGKMKTMFYKMKDSSEEAVLYLKDKEGVDIDSRDFLFRYMINVIADVSFGIKADAFNEEKEKDNLFVKMSRKLFRPSVKLQLAQLLAMSSPKLKEFFKLKMADSEVNDFFHKLTRDLIKYRQSSDSKRNDFLQLMLDEQHKELNYIASATESKVDQQNAENSDEEADDLELFEHLKNVKFDKKFQVFTDNSIAAQTLIFVAGGTETTAATLSFALYELAVNKTVQIQAQQVVDDIVKSQGITYESVKKMTYLDQILNEVLRLRPVGGSLPRICSKDYKLPGTSLIIKKGTMITIPVAAMHTDPEYFPDPETFNPDRFQNMEAIPKGVFMPFGGGPRICIAMRLAMLKMRVFLAVILSHYNIILSKKTKTPLKLDSKSFLQHVEGGLWLQFEPRRK